MGDFGWYRIYEGPMMLRPGTDVKLLHARQRRCCGVCADKLKLIGTPIVYDGPPDEDEDHDDFSCHYCGTYLNEKRLRVAS
jgi:hypothetical protein